MLHDVRITKVGDRHYRIHTMNHVTTRIYRCVDEYSLDVKHWSYYRLDHMCAEYVHVLGYLDDTFVSEDNNVVC
jgi:hypothetical protein